MPGAMTERLAEGFPPRGAQDWVAEVERRGAHAEGLRATTEDGLVLEPVYFGPAAGPVSREWPGLAPFARGDRAAGALPYGWGIRQPLTDPDLDRSNRAALSDLERGVTEVLLTFDAPTRRGEDPDRAPDAGRGGLPLASVDDLDLVLAGVLDDLAPVALDAGPGGLPAAALLVALWKRRGRDLSTIRGSLGVAPLSGWASTGALPGGPDRALADLAVLHGWAAAEAPSVQVARADELPFHEAGASDALGLGLALAELTAGLRAAHGEGVDLAAALRQTELQLALGPEVFGGVAKLRAARLLVSRLAELLGIEDDAARPALVARQGRRGLTSTDPWVNLLRGTAATFAAAVGGARSFVLEPFDVEAGLPEELGRRMARNTQLILQEESHLFRVVDPAGGSGYVEARTDALAEAAWRELQAVEAEGGLTEALRSGWVRTRLAEQRATRQAAVDRGRRPLTGTTHFPLAEEPPLERAPCPPPSQVAEAAGARLALTRARGARIALPDAGSGRVRAAVEAAAAGATLGAIAATLGPSEALEPLPAVRLSEPFEALRRAVRAASPPPVHLANIGPLARHTARATFVQNLVGVAGFTVRHGPPTTDPAEAAAAFTENGAHVAVICGSQDDYPEHAAAFARALKAAGARAIRIAGRTGELAEALAAAGVDGHYALGDDIRAHLSQLLADHGLDPEGAPR